MSFYVIEGITVNLWFSGAYLLNHSKEELRKKILMSRFLGRASQIMNSKIDSFKIDISDRRDNISR